MTKTEPNWRAIEGPYRGGIISVRQIARAFDVTLSRLQKHAKKNGWTRNLAPRVREATQKRLAGNARTALSDLDTDLAQSQAIQGATEEESRVISSDGSPSHAQADIPVEDIIDAASRLQADVVRDHRKDLARTHRLCNKLVAELEAHTDSIDVIQAEIEAAVAGDSTDKQRRVLERAVSHATRASSMRALAGAQKELIALEREAFGLNADVKENTAATLEERIKQYEFEDARDKALKADDGRVVHLGV